LPGIAGTSPATALIDQTSSNPANGSLRKDDTQFRLLGAGIFFPPKLFF